MFPFGFDKQKALEKYYPQCQHNMMVTDLPLSYLSIITGAAQHVIIPVEQDLFYQIELLEAEKDFRDCVETGRTPGVPTIDVPLVERIKVIDMSQNNEWGNARVRPAQHQAGRQEARQGEEGDQEAVPARCQVAPRARASRSTCRRTASS